MDRKPDDDEIKETIRKALEQKLGSSTAKALEFYIDPSIALSNPAMYERMLTKTFGGGTEHITKMVIQEISRKYGIPQSEGMTLSQCIEALRNPANQ